MNFVFWDNSIECDATAGETEVQETEVIFSYISTSWWVSDPSLNSFQVWDFLFCCGTKKPPWVKKFPLLHRRALSGHSHYLDIFWTLPWVWGRNALYLPKAELLFFLFSRLCLTDTTLPLTSSFSSFCGLTRAQRARAHRKTHRSKTELIFIRVIHAILSTVLASDTEEENPLRKYNLYEPICLSPL